MEKKKWQKKEGGRKAPPIVGPTVKYNVFLFFHLIFKAKDRNDPLFVYIMDYLDKVIYINDQNNSTPIYERPF